jgi:hypothetical protein
VAVPFDSLALTLMNQMDVDPPTSLPSSSKKRPAASPPASSSADKCAKLLLPDSQLTALTDIMKHKSDRKKWLVFVKEARDDDTLWRDLISDVLMHLLGELASTNMKGSMIASPNPERADDIVKSFNEAELEQWKVGMRNGVEKNNWIELIAHRTYISDYQIIRSH